MNPMINLGVGVIYGALTFELLLLFYIRYCEMNFQQFWLVFNLAYSLPLMPVLLLVIYNFYHCFF